MSIFQVFHDERNAARRLSQQHDGTFGAGSPNHQAGVFGSRQQLSTNAGPVTYYRLSELAEQGQADLSRMPLYDQIFLETVLRHAGSDHVSEEDVLKLAHWNPQQPENFTFAFLPARVILQDFTGVPAVVDLAAMRTAVAKLGGDPERG